MSPDDRGVAQARTLLGELGWLRGDDAAASHAPEKGTP